MGYYDYDVASVRQAYRYKAARSAVLNPLLGRWWHSTDVAGAMKKLRSLWHKHLRIMQQAGWVKLSNGNRNLVYAANCPPFGVMTKQSARCCKLSFCPFCYARSNVLTPFMRLERAIYGSYEPDAKPLRDDLVMVDFCTKRTLRPAFVGETKKRDWTAENIYEVAVMGAISIVRGGRHRELDAWEPLGGVIHHRVVPGERRGIVRVTRSGIFLCQRDRFNADAFKPGVFEKHDHRVQEPTKKNLYKVAGRIFGYPAGLLDLPADDLIAYLDMMRKVRLMSCFGLVKADRSEDEECSTDGGND